jgi:hypothetical protein
MSGMYVPATSATPADVAGPRPQNMSEDERESMGLLSLTTRVADVALSVEPTQRSCHVEWAETVAAAARSTMADFIFADVKLEVERRDGRVVSV